MRRSAALTMFLCLGLLACRTQGRSGQLELRWRGTDHGGLSAAATAQWCSPLRLLEIRSIKGDTGVAVAIYPAETLIAGSYPIKAPPKAESIPPAAALALRWAGPTSVRGFQGESGTVILQRSPRGEISGRVSSSARSATDTGVLVVTGQFRQLPVRSTKEGCVARDTSDARRTDTLIH